MRKDIDKDLLELFQREDRKILDEPFLQDTSARIESLRFRTVMLRRSLQVLGIVAVVLASPWLIDGSIWLTDKLETIFASVSSLLDTRIGMIIVVALSAPVVFWNRKRIF